MTDVRIREPKQIQVDLIYPDPLNPNRMQGKKFQKFVEVIRTQGFDEPIQVAPHPDIPGSYIIVGGEHRWRAAKELGLFEIPCVVYEEWTDPGVRHEKLVQRNALRGDLDYGKFSELVRRMVDCEGQDIADLAAEWGMKNEEELRALISQASPELTPPPVPPSDEEGDKRVRLLDNTSYVLEQVLASPDTVKGDGMILFFHMNKLVFVVQMGTPLKNALQQLMRQEGGNRVEIEQVLLEVVNSRIRPLEKEQTP